MKNFFILLFLLTIPWLCNAQIHELTLNVMTYNIQQGSYYNPETTPQAVSEIITKNDIDILGSQELHIDGVKSLSSVLPDYLWFGVGREDGKVTGETGCVFYKKNRFTLLEQSTFWLSETPNVVGSKSWNSADVRIVTWGKFTSKENASTFFVFNTHFDHISSLARQESSKLLLKKINEIAGKYPVIITGDFNMTSDMNEYKILVASYYQYLRLYDTKFISQTPSTGPSGTFTDYTNPNPTEKIDFVFTNPFFEVLSLAVLTDKYNGKYISDHYPIKVQVRMKHPVSPKTPTLKAVASNNKVSLYWDSISETETREPFTDNTNDFQGYKLYKSRTPDMSDAVLVPGKWSVPLLRKPLFECDLIDDKYGYTNYGIVDGFGYFLGNDTGIQHYYIDEDVKNGQTYYYVLIAYDHGIPTMADGFAPLETPFVLQTDATGKVITKSSNVDFAIPFAPQQGSETDLVVYENKNVKGSGSIDVRVVDPTKLKDGSYKIKFDVDTLAYNAILNPKYRSPRDMYIVNSGFKIYSVNNNSVVYGENKASYISRNVTLNPFLNYYYLNTSSPVVTDQIDGFQVVLNNLVEKAELDTANSKWQIGNSQISILPSSMESYYFPWNCEIRFGESYKTLTNLSKGIYDVDGSILAYTQILLNETFGFCVINKDFPNEKLDMLAIDVDLDGVFDLRKDKVLVGYSVVLANKVYWAGTVFSVSFKQATGNLPKPGDLYQVIFKRPFFDTDEVVFRIDKGTTDIHSEKDESINTEYSLEQNYPNPFNPTTKIRYRIPFDSNVNLSVFNILGEKVAELVNMQQNAGDYEIEWNATRVASGLYIYKMNALSSLSRYSAVRKMILIK